MDQKEIGKIFYRDGFRLAMQHLEEELSPERLKAAVKALYEAMDGLLEAFLSRAREDGKPAACKKGCDYCCHQSVFAVSHEVLYLEDFIRRNKSTGEGERYLEKARSKSLLTLNKPMEDMLKQRQACPFLEEGACSVYEARPMACRIYLSSSLKSCEREHLNKSKAGQKPELYEFPLQAGRMLNEGFVAYLRQRKMESTELPLEQSYASIQTLGQDFASWLG